ncbi:hypothetical protein SKAU_G00098550 [Synaphobranchus kaupii]|uniref:Uncharacterized protein n=1 Tax=Synaphobranchus kaupii TaxID=118154 RepID=A0A9Q1J652_SYNKA|nr:hypothetical protein SKAU_G00098550 [Synaphobranchus kaupii]
MLVLFNALGCLTAFNHQPVVSFEVSPAIQMLWRVPPAPGDAVAKELTSLLETAISLEALTRESEQDPILWTLRNHICIG